MSAKTAGSESQELLPTRSEQPNGANSGRLEAIVETPPSSKVRATRELWRKPGYITGALLIAVAALEAVGFAVGIFFVSRLTPPGHRSSVFADDVAVLCHQLAAGIEREMDSLDRGVQDLGAAAHFAPPFSQAQLDLFISFSRITDFPIRSLAYSPIVLRDDLAAWEARNSLTVLEIDPSFPNTSTTDSTPLIPASLLPKPAYAPLAFRYYPVNDVSNNSGSRLGLDLLGPRNTVFSAALKRGSSVVSIPTALPSASLRMGFYTVFPVFSSFKARQPLDFVPDYLNASTFDGVLGFLTTSLETTPFFEGFFSAFNLSDVSVQSELSALLRVLDNYEIRVWDTTVSPAALMFLRPGSSSALNEIDPEYSVNASAAILDREWAVGCTPTKTLVMASVDTFRTDIFVLAIALVVGLSLAALIGFVVFRAVLARKAASSGLALLAERSRQLVAALPDMLIVLDATGHVKAANTVALETTSYVSEQLCGLSIHSLLSDSSVDAGNAEKPGQAERIRTLICKDGTQVPVEVSSAPVAIQEVAKPATRIAKFLLNRHTEPTRRRSNTEKALQGESVLLLRDITDRVAKDRALRDSMRTTELADRRTWSVLRYLCHELRNPVHAILASTERQPGATEEQSAAAVVSDAASVATAAASISSLVDDVLLYVTLKRNTGEPGLEVASKSFDACQVLDQVLTRNNAAPASWTGARCVLGDVAKFTVVVEKMVALGIWTASQAADAAPTSRLSVRGSCGAEESEEGAPAKATLEVVVEAGTALHTSDAPVPSPLARSIDTEPFTDDLLGSSVGPSFGARGLWLAVLKLLTDKLGGSVVVTEWAGGIRLRAAFAVGLGEDSEAPADVAPSGAVPDLLRALPALLPSASAETVNGEDSGQNGLDLLAAPKSNAAPEPGKAARPLIIVAEDNAIVAKLTTKMLQKAGYTSEIAIDGQDCVEKAANYGFRFVKLILMDLQMPRLTGVGAASRLRSLGFSGPILAVTAFANLPDIDECTADGLMQGVLKKPVAKVDLIRAVEKALTGDK